MNRSLPQLLHIFLPLLFLQALPEAFAQTSSFPLKEWVNKLDLKKDADNQNFLSINKQLSEKDSVVAYSALAELEKSGASASRFFMARLLCLKALAQYRFNYPNGKLQVKQLFEAAIKEAYETGDEDLIAHVSWTYGEQMYVYQEIELAATYCIKAVEINNKFLNQPRNYPYSALLAEILFHAGEYEKSIYYNRMSIANWPGTPLRDYYVTRLWNTIGQAYQRLGRLDSAFINYERSMLIANKINLADWKAFNSGFMGHILFLRKEYEKAKPLLAYSYSNSQKYDPDIAAYSLQWMARINLIQGKKDTALQQAKEALRILTVRGPALLQKANFLQYAYYTAADVYRSMGKTDSFYHYFQLYINLHDSLERVAVRSSSEISKMRNDNEKNLRAIQVMQRQKSDELLKRNFIISAIIMVSVIALLLVNRQRQRLKYKHQLALQQKAAAESEVAAAKEQLNMFTQNIIEKSNLIEKLEQQVKANVYNFDQQQIDRRTYTSSHLNGR